MKEIMIATSNAHKVKEFKTMLEPLGYQVKSLLDLDESIDIEENGTTFAENARIKAKAIYDLLHIEVLADDSGLCVDAMDGAPGIYSARFMGHDTAYDVKNRYIIEQCEGKERGCAFVCAIAYIDKAGNDHVFEGEVRGSVAYEIVGAEGFGYDPIFYYEPFKTTLANVSEEQKNEVSHRSRALTKFLTYLQEEAV